jgi:hypothetical protein
MTRKEIVALIFNNLKSNQTNLKKKFDAYKNEIGFFYLDNLLPA